MRLLIVDDDSLIRKSLQMTLSRQEDIDVIAVAENGQVATAICLDPAQNIQAVLMDIRMPVMNGIEAVKAIKSQRPDIHIMMLTTFDDRPNIQEALAAGADGYLLKSDRIEGIAVALRTMMAGTGVVDINVLKKLAPTPGANPALKVLTPRELDITKLVSLGKSNKEIAAELFLSEGTVRNNIVNIMEKLNVQNRTQLGVIYTG